MYNLQFLQQNIDKVRTNAYDACNRLGKYRMPFAWTAIWLQNIIKGKGSAGGESNSSNSTANNTLREQQGGDSGSDADSTASNSLDRKASTSSFEQFRRSAAAKSAGGIGNFNLSKRINFDKSTISLSIYLADSTSLRRQSSLERKSTDKRSSWAGQSLGTGSSTIGGGASTASLGGAAAEDSTSSQLDSFPPVTLTVSSFFKQEGDKLR